MIDQCHRNRFHAIYFYGRDFEGNNFDGIVPTQVKVDEVDSTTDSCKRILIILIQLLIMIQ